MSTRRYSPELEQRIFRMYRNVRYQRLKHGLIIKRMAEVAGTNNPQRMGEVERCIRAGLLSNENL